MTGRAVHDTIFPALAAGMCQDAGITVTFSEYCRFNPRTRVIEIRQELVEDTPEKVIGLLSHEIGHVLVTRYNLLKPRSLPHGIWASFMNSIEDPRANRAVQQRYPGSDIWFDSMYAMDREEPASSPSRFRCWSLAVSVADAYGFDEAPQWIAHDRDVVRAFDETRQARYRYAHELPPDELAGAAPDKSLGGDFERYVRPVLIDDRGLSHEDRSEKLVLLSAARALAVAHEEILPSASRLIEKDEQAIATFLDGEPELAHRLERMLARDQSSAIELIETALSTTPRDGDHHERPLARRALARYLERLQAQSESWEIAVGPTDRERSRASARFRARGRASPVDRAFVSREVARQVPRLKRDIEAVIVPRSRMELHSGFASGQRIDLPRAMVFDATRRGHEGLWSRYEKPEGRQAAISLLVDLSGSMEGSKTDAAIAGTMVVAEVLGKLAPDVRFAVNGFQDALIPVMKFGDAFTPASRNAILDMALEVHGCRPAGHNNPGNNDDGPCVDEAADQLARQPGQRMLLVISDGRPAGRRSKEGDLRKAVHRLSCGYAGISLFGLGIGEGTAHVQDFYPNAIANIPIDAFAYELGQLLRRVLRGGQSKFR